MEARDRGYGTIVREASELGIAPGRWPLSVSVNTVRFVHVFVNRDVEGDIASVTYVEPGTGARLVVLND